MLASSFQFEYSYLYEYEPLDLRKIKILLEYGADVNAQNNEG